ncbi:MAG: hypothetical protein R2824_22175 [Saprospiraceae bacterium]
MAGTLWFFRLHSGKTYQFDLSFSVSSAGNEQVTEANYKSRQWSIRLVPSTGKNYRLVSMPSQSKLSLILQITGSVGTQEKFTVQLLDPQKKLIAASEFPLSIVSNAVDLTLGASMIQTSTSAVYLTYGRSATSRKKLGDKLGVPDTIYLDATTQKQFSLQIEQVVSIRGKSKTVYADSENPYGYKASFRWLGRIRPGDLPKLSYKKNMQYVIGDPPKEGTPRGKIDRSRFGIPKTANTVKKYGTMMITIRRHPDVITRSYNVVIGLME